MVNPGGFAPGVFTIAGIRAVLYVWRMTDEQFTTIVLDELRKILQAESDYQQQRNNPDRETLHLLYRLNIRLDQLQMNLIKRGCVVGKFQSLHLRDPYK